MASITKRKELVNELRKAHFHLGFESNKDAESEYIHKYKEYEINMNRQPKDLRAHHYELGDDDTAYQSEFKEKFGPKQAAEKIALSDDKKDDLRKQHFTLGYDNDAPLTTYNENYYKKGVPLENATDKQQKVNALRKHNHEFGDALTYFSSMYNEQHNKNMENHQQQPKVPIDGNLLRKTNMILGNANPNYVTQHADTYTKKSNPGTHILAKPPTNIDLGQDNGNFKSSHMRDFGHKAAIPEPVDKARIQDFKSAHFNLGTPSIPTNYASEHRDMYNEKPIDVAQPAGKPPSNVQLDHGNEDTFNSTYKDNYLGKPGDKAMPIKPSGEIGGVVMGSDPNDYISEGRANFVKHPYQDNRLDPNRKKVLAGVSLELGDDGRDYTTQHRDTYVDRFLQLQRAGLSEKERDDLRKKHFEHGFHNGVYSTSNAAYGKETGPANKLDAEVQKGMRRTNIHDSDPDIKKTTTYKTAFHWKQNPDF